jgi:hypothetical protein
MSYRKYKVLVSVLILGSILAANVASAQCGDPANSRFPNHIVLCPSGDLSVMGQVLDVNGNPCVASTIHLLFQAPAILQLWSHPADPFPLYTATTNLAGTVMFNPRVGGCAMGGSVIYYDPSGVVLGTSQTVNSPDINGDGVVNLADIPLFTAAYFGGYSPCCDFNMDGVLNLLDIGYLSQHYGH